MLVVQYRMNTKIMRWASKALYQNKLVADPSVADRLLSHLPYVKPTESTNTPLTLVDTQGCYLNEFEGNSSTQNPLTATDTEGSKYNEGEAEVVREYVKELLESGIREDDIAGTFSAS